ncbi:hypothetical protein BFP78_13225 [Gaetbulibacter sp. 5U11]|nr:hypothetical protein BFP78_13225 [Gaetbulibacter sp. 5U11]
MDMMSLIVGIIGGLASIIGAYVAITEAKKAKKSADKAELMKNAIATEQKKINLGKIFNETIATMRVSVMMATSATPDKKIRGLDYQKSIDTIRKYIDVLKENCHYLPDAKVQIVENKYKSIESELVTLAKENDQIKKYEIGDSIHNSMGEIVKQIKPELDVKTFANNVYKK